MQIKHLQAVSPTTSHLMMSIWMQLTLAWEEERSDEHIIGTSQGVIKC